MANNRPYPPGKNPFFNDNNDRRNRDEDDVDDMTFLKSRPANYVLGSEQSSDYNIKRQQLMEERRRVEERTLASAKTSLGLLYESEKVGLSTAEELVRQGEKLQHIDSQLDSMNSTMRTTQKHLTSMKSLFGGIKNYFGGKSETPPVPAGTSNGTSGERPKYESQLGSTIESLSNKPATSSNHPTFARKGIVFEEDEEEQPRSFTAKSGYAARSQEIEKALDSNLGELSLGLGRLKNLAMGLGTEIETQNDMIERIMTKEERAEETLGYQNRQMKQILKK